MKKSVAILLGGLLIVSLSNGSSRTRMQGPCAALHHEMETACHLTNQANDNAMPDSVVALTALQEPAEEQKAAITNRILQLVDAFGKLVMVI